MKKEVLLNSTFIDSPAYLYDLVRQSLWLMKTRDDVQKVKICLHPVRIGLTPLSLFGLLKNSDLYDLSRRLGHYIIALARRLSPSSKSGLENKAHSLYNIVCSCSAVQINTQFGIIEFFYIQKKLNLSFAERIKLDFKTLQLLSKAKLRGKINPQLLLNLHYSNTQVGDLISSTALRTCYRAAGSLLSCNNLHSVVAKSIAISDYFSRYMKSNSEIDSYVTIPEPTYLHAIYLRMGHGLGCGIIESHNYNLRLSLTLPGAERSSPFIVDRMRYNTISEQQISAVDNYMHKRFFSKRNPLWYMYNGTNDEDSKVIVGLNENVIDISNSELYVVVFLHSFDDGQYYYGLDGFNDLYHWTTSTLDALVSNNQIAKVLIKPHPNSDHQEYQGDKRAQARLYSKYQNEKISWLNSKTSIRLLAQIKHIIGITHHGSVAEELAYLNVPVIGCGVASPWSDNYDFVNTWKTPKDYIQMLKKLDKSWPQSIQENSRLSIYPYLHLSRIQAKPQEDVSAWLIYDQLANGSLKISETDYKRVRDELCGLELDSHLCNEFIRKLEFSLD